MPLKPTRDEMPAINLTPMIDIVFQLIIFFMVGTKFTEMERKLDVNVPSVGPQAQLAAAPEKHLVNVYTDGHLVFKQQEVTLPQLKSEMRVLVAEQGEPQIVIRGDELAPLKHITAVMVACREAGVAEMSISVRLGTATKGR